MNDFIELSRVVEVVLRRWWLVIGLTIIAAVAGYLVSQQMSPVYQATTTMMVGQFMQSADLNRTDIQTSEALAITYANIAVRQPVMQGVVDALGLNQSWQDVKKQVSVSTVEGSQLLEITVEATTPTQASAIADEVTNQLILMSPTGLKNQQEEIESAFLRAQIVNVRQRIEEGQNRINELDAQIESTTSESKLAELQKEKTDVINIITEWEKSYVSLSAFVAQDKSPNYLVVIEPAHASSSPVRPRIPFNTLMSGVFGAVLALGIIFIMDLMDDTYKSLNEVYESKDLNVLGVVGTISGKSDAERILSNHSPFSPVTESYRIIRSNIPIHSKEHPTRSIIVTSSISGEGKSLTAANLAVVMAQAGYQTILVDADFRRPSLHTAFSVKNEGGLSDLLLSPEQDIVESLKSTSTNRLRLLTVGSALEDPTERLESSRMTEIVNCLEQAADIVIYDSPPVMLVADTRILAKLVDGTVLVLRAGKSRRSATRQALADLQKADAKLLGVVFNKAIVQSIYGAYKKA